MLSILIPVYNYDISLLLQKIYAEASSLNIPFEIVVIDDKSEKSFLEKNKTQTELINCRFIENKINLGRTESRKILAESALYSKLLFLDSDVIPVSDSFIKNYIDVINEAPIILGGYEYLKNSYSDENSLRYWYGKSREEKMAEERNLSPYSSVFSGNLLTDKVTFLKNNYPENHNIYGLDIYFAYNLYINKVPLLHIDNPIYHLGLENNETFFKKCLESVDIRKRLLADKQNIEKVNSLLKHYKNLKEYHLTGLVSFGFKITEPLLKKLIFRKKPNLLSLDLYRLGYICSLKD
ncbi:glycosyltransferase family 2 protein [Flavobacterium beibuense]|uniref:Putative beta-glycosyltransferase n=1 Tax=Flavobacterium beibuense TaxID=657326 RepID=A0A444W897_9FLAO|nr:glycosyltransferase [Flavobacterium beibuense]RYJ41866.1 putative beta-glycosyltransferase [Flavobacterium beibuense]